VTLFVEFHSVASVERFSARAAVSRSLQIALKQAGDYHPQSKFFLSTKLEI
jgi:hypothetical protein